MARTYEQFLPMYEISRDYGRKMNHIQNAIYDGLCKGFNYSEAFTALSNAGFVTGFLLTGPLAVATGTLVGALAFFASIIPSERETMKKQCDQGLALLDDVLVPNVMGDPQVEAIKIDISVTVIENDDSSFVKYVTAASKIKAVRKNGVWMTR